MSKPKLTYWNGRGYGELIRLVLVDSGVDFEDHRMDNDDDTEWDALKPSTPFGQAPLYTESDGFVVAQSVTILRYLAKKHGLYGKDDRQAAIADMVVDGLYDHIRAIQIAKTDEEKAAFGKEKLPVWLGYFENILKKNGGEYFAGTFTYADIVASEVLDNRVERNFPGDLKNFPLLTALVQRVNARPKIAAWIAKRKPSDY
eukprot:TRINITY_DN804_c0_g1_i1.p1 TRINITY_DN804_c0_g1~~TRINITY_DN804_c0_g1_i1.p1  ORF type:complete len:201 (+),score=49.54 TRINITY_DN804_c0_g1_i1:68-670(+)